MYDISFIAWFFLAFFWSLFLIIISLVYLKSELHKKKLDDLQYAIDELKKKKEIQDLKKQLEKN